MIRTKFTAEAISYICEGARKKAEEAFESSTNSTASKEEAIFVLELSRKASAIADAMIVMKQDQLIEVSEEFALVISYSLRS